MNDPPSDDTTADLLLSDLIDIVIRKQQRGERVSWEDFASDYSHCLPQLRDLLPTLEILTHLARRDVSKPLARGETEVPAWAAESLLGDFRLLREIGRGGMGVVYEHACGTFALRRGCGSVCSRSGWKRSAWF